MLNFSKTKIKCIPLVNSLKKLTHLLLSRCLELERLRGINGVTSLQVLDLSNASKFNEFHDQSLDGIVGFKILDLSGTAIDHLPSKIGNPLHLFLRGCTRLEDLSCLETLKDLELIDISKLQLKTLPSLSHLHNLRSLSVTCSNLVKLPDLSDLKLLEVLDLSGCSEFEFYKMTPLSTCLAFGSSTFLRLGSTARCHHFHNSPTSATSYSIDVLD